MTPRTRSPTPPVFTYNNQDREFFKYQVLSTSSPYVRYSHNPFGTVVGPFDTSPGYSKGLFSLVTTPPSY